MHIGAQFGRQLHKPALPEVGGKGGQRGELHDVGPVRQLPLGEHVVAGDGDRQRVPGREPQPRGQASPVGLRQFAAGDAEGVRSPGCMRRTLVSGWPAQHRKPIGTLTNESTAMPSWPGNGELSAMQNSISWRRRRSSIRSGSCRSAKINKPGRRRHTALTSRATSACDAHGLAAKRTLPSVPLRSSAASRCSSAACASRRLARSMKRAPTLVSCTWRLLRSNSVSPSSSSSTWMLRLNAGPLSCTRRAARAKLNSSASAAAWVRRVRSIRDDSGVVAAMRATRGRFAVTAANRVLTHLRIHDSSATHF